MKTKIKNLNKGDIFRHPDFNFKLTVSDNFDEGIIQTENIHPKTGEHIFFIGTDLEYEVLKLKTKTNKLTHKIR